MIELVLNEIRCGFQVKDKDFGTQEQLLNSLNEFKLCCNWLKDKKVTKKQTVDSYYLKHVVEKDVETYISNGIFICSVIYMDIPYKKHLHSPNITVALSRKEFDKCQNIY